MRRVEVFNNRIVAAIVPGHVFGNMSVLLSLFESIPHVIRAA